MNTSVACRVLAGRVLLLGAAASVLLAAAGCETISSLTSDGSTVQVRSTAGTGAALETTLPTRVYAWFDDNTADVYLTDLSPDALASADVGAGDGNLVHIHMFLNPEAGMTPIADTACSVTVRHAIFAKGRVGIYGGGGFLNPSGKPGDASFGGQVTDATVRLLSSTPGFEDKLGPAQWSCGFKADENRPGAIKSAEKLRATIAAITKENPPAAPAAPAPAAPAPAASAPKP
ncbi:MAG: hypothetical protein SFY96_07995 [Planctomycetota bacterium]|nr:hypothetical protein [Planctomycetota bacterium]